MRDPSSFRDPDGHVIIKGENVYRVINNSYKENYDHFINSGLYNELVDKKMITPFNEETDKPKNSYKYLKTKYVYPILYPYEWSFSQLKEAALLTLSIQKICLKYEMTLKDATPFNVQFIDCKPVFIDLLSFEKIKDFQWRPLKQFYQMFFGPLIVFSKIDPSLLKLLITNIDGISVLLINKLLKFKQKLNLNIFINLVLPNIFSKKNTKTSKSLNLNKQKLENLISYLYSSTNKIKFNRNSEWKNYNEETYQEKSDYVLDKQNLINKFKDLINHTTEVWDIGGNDGRFSRAFCEISKHVFSFDIDVNCVDDNYNINKSKNIYNVYPILFDLTNPSPSIGWNNKERRTIEERLNRPNLICMFAVIHHLFNKNILFDEILSFSTKTDRFLIIEYIPIEDPKCKLIFESRDKKFLKSYPDEKNFENIFQKKFSLIKSGYLGKTKRKLYLYERKNTTS